MRYRKSLIYIELCTRMLHRDKRRFATVLRVSFSVVCIIGNVNNYVTNLKNNSQRLYLSHVRLAQNTLDKM